MRKAQETSSSPEVIQRSIGDVRRLVAEADAPEDDPGEDAGDEQRAVVMSSEGRAPSARPNRPAMSAAEAGRKTMAE